MRLEARGLGFRQDGGHDHGVPVMVEASFESYWPESMPPHMGLTVTEKTTLPVVSCSTFVYSPLLSMEAVSSFM